MRFILCGAGAIGGVLGGQLAKAGFDVLYIDKIPAHVQAINQHGLQLRGVHGNHTLRIPAVMQASAIAFRPDDVIFMAVKSFHCDAAAAELRRATELELPIFCAQNGMANEGTVARYFHNVHGMMVLIGAKRLEPGVVVHTGNGPVGLGTYPEGLSQVAEDVAAALEATDLPMYTTEHIGQHKWHKMLLNLNNATMGLTGFSIQEGWAHAAGRLWMADVWEEGARVLDSRWHCVRRPTRHGDDCRSHWRITPDKRCALLCQLPKNCKDRRRSGKISTTVAAKWKPTISMGKSSVLGGSITCQHLIIA